jgi:hypothetical protein
MSAFHPLRTSEARYSLAPMRLSLCLVSAALLMALAAPADALCIYNGIDNARTTMRQEYADSRWVVHARVISATDGVVEAGYADAGSSWTLYRLQVVHAYKGRVPQRISFFTARDSGGFYMDRSWVPLPKGHDIGGEYLLFLNPIRPYPDQPMEARGATFVNYNCGQSRAWREVPIASRQSLASLSRRR